MGKTKYYATRTEFYENESSYVHSFIWIFNAPNIQNEAASLGLLRKTKNSQLLAYLNDPDVFLLVKNYQVYVHSSNLLKTQNCNFTNDEKNEVLTLTNTLLPQVKTFSNNTLIPLIFTQHECAKINSARSMFFHAFWCAKINVA